MCKGDLTPKQARFVDEYLIDLNATAAAIRAGYSEKNARIVAAQNLTKINIQQVLAKRLKDRQQRTEITQDYVLHNLKSLADRSMQFDDAPHMQAAIKANELLGKHLGMFREAVQMDGELRIQIDYGDG
ncbi:MAG: terminase small subunit [Pyramidobacter sp.]|nr:terminase small subunit [Pyramidobacter sp.]